MSRSEVNVPRLIRIATLLFAVLAGTLVFLTYQPQVEALQQRLQDDASTLRSDETVFHTMAQLRVNRAELARRYATLFAQNPEAVFLRDLSGATQRHGITLVSTSVSHDENTADGQPHSPLFAQTRVDVQMRGSYARLLAAVGDLSAGSEIVRVDAPTMRRDDDQVLVTIPVTIFEPAKHNELPFVSPAQRGIAR